MVTMARPLIGDKTEAFGADPSDPKTYEFRYKVVDIHDLVTSHDDKLNPNASYPQELQPRIRDRAASKIQIDSMAANLNPRVLLHDSGFLDTGPMIVGGDNVVESGNGRTLALRKAANDNSDGYQLYKTMLWTNAKKYGIDTEALRRFDRPVLVRERLSDVNRVKFAADANVGAVMGMSPYEQALQDSRRLSDNVISNLEVGEEQTIDQALRAKANNHIIDHFISTVPANERATISESGGNINQKGLDRLKLAIFAKTYTGESGQRLVRIFGENVDPVIKSMENAMFQSLPDMAKAESLIESGQREKSLSVAGDMAEVMDTLASLKQSNLSTKDYLAQSAMFEDKLTPFQKSLLDHLDDISHKSKMVREFIRDTADAIVKSPAKGQASMLGYEPPTKGEILNAVINRQRNEIGKPPIRIAAPSPTGKGLEKPNAGGSGGAKEPPKETRKTAEEDRPDSEKAKPESVMPAHVSMQAGLAGMGPEAVQVKAFEEFGTAPGAGGKKETLVDVEKILEAEKAKPLPGQIDMLTGKKVGEDTELVKPVVEAPKTEQGGQPSKSDVLKRQARRTPRARALDSSLSAPIVSPPRYPTWIKDPAHYDVHDVDTKTSITNRKPSLSRSITRITPRRPRLR